MTSKKAITSAMDAAIQKFNLSTNQVIEIRSIDNNNVFYRTTITLNQSITNDWPQTPPSADDLYWKTHKELVDAALKARQELLLKIVETIGSAVGGLVSGGKSSSKT